jgi:hypothetical protein
MEIPMTPIIEEGKMLAQKLESLCMTAAGIAEIIERTKEKKTHCESAMRGALSGSRNERTHSGDNQVLDFEVIDRP